MTRFGSQNRASIGTLESLWDSLWKYAYIPPLPSRALLLQPRVFTSLWVALASVILANAMQVDAWEALLHRRLPFYSSGNPKKPRATRMIRRDMHLSWPYLPGKLQPNTSPVNKHILDHPDAGQFLIDRQPTAHTRATQASIN